MMVRAPVYGDAMGAFSSGKMERRLPDDLALLDRETPKERALV